MNRSRIREGTAISLFPFLAVLLCTMGALLVLLVLFGYSAGQQDQAAAAAEAEAAAAELRLAIENLRWRRDQLAEMRAKTSGDLESLRLQLAGVEDNSRELADELKQLEKLGQKLLAADDSAAPDEAKLAELEAALAAAQKRLAEAREDRNAKPPAYAVVPYEGSGGTRRRPLFIECSLDGVFLQPEGIRLNPSDFEGPPGPGNPLASALRAAREYLAGQAVSRDDPALRPYPLLLVRPSGVMAYYAAREAIASWGSDFGYQLIDEDWRMAFPKKDLALQDVEMQAINEARERLQWLAQTRSTMRRNKPAAKQYRASSVRGGVVAEGGPSVLGDQSRWDWSKQQAAATQAGPGGSGFGGGPGGGAADGYGGGGQTTGQPGVVGRPVSASGGMSGTGLGRGGAASGLGSGEGGSETGSLVGLMPGAGTSGRFSAGEQLAASAGGPAGGGDGGVAGQAGTSGGPGQAGSDGQPMLAGQPGAAGDAAGAGPNGSATEGDAGAPSSGGLAAAGAAGSGGSSDGANDAAAGAGGGGASGPQLPLGMQVGSSQANLMMSSGGQGESAEGQSQAGSCCQPLAGVRGSDWASFATSQRYIPLTRPIQLECSQAEIRLLDESGRRVAERIPLFGPTVESVDLLVEAVRRRVTSWGIAGDRLYWKPELVLTETSDGARRRQDLQQLLVGSGLDTRLRQQMDEVERLPPVPRRRRAAGLGVLPSTAEVTR
jgi:hypothetical protein